MLCAWPRSCNHQLFSLWIELIGARTQNWPNSDYANHHTTDVVRLFLNHATRYIFFLSKNIFYPTIYSVESGVKHHNPNPTPSFYTAYLCSSSTNFGINSGSFSVKWLCFNFSLINLGSMAVMLSLGRDSETQMFYIYKCINKIRLGQF